MAAASTTAPPDQHWLLKDPATFLDWCETNTRGVQANDLKSLVMNIFFFIDGKIQLMQFQPPGASAALGPQTTFADRVRFDDQAGTRVKVPPSDRSLRDMIIDALEYGIAADQFRDIQFADLMYDDVLVLSNTTASELSIAVVLSLDPKHMPEGRCVIRRADNSHSRWSFTQQPLERTALELLHARKGFGGHFTLDDIRNVFLRFFESRLPDVSEEEEGRRKVAYCLSAILAVQNMKLKTTQAKELHNGFITVTYTAPSQATYIFTVPNDFGERDQTNKIVHREEFYYVNTFFRNKTEVVLRDLFDNELDKLWAMFESGRARVVWIAADEETEYRARVDRPILWNEELGKWAIWRPSRYSPEFSILSTTASSYFGGSMDTEAFLGHSMLEDSMQE